MQRQLASAIVQPDTLLPDAGGVAALLVAPPQGTTLTRLQVYAGGYPARVHEALGETYPALAHVLGAAPFDRLVHRYADAVPLRSYNLNDAGAQLPEFLRRDPLSDSLPFLPDLAALEWQVTRAFHAYEEPPLDPAPLAAWSLDDWAGAVLRLQPSVALVRSDWPIREIWEARGTPVEEIDIDMRDRPDRVLVHRLGFDVHCESIGDDEALALEMLLAGRTLGELNQQLANSGHDPAAVSGCFAGWMQRGLIASCTCG